MKTLYTCKHEAWGFTGTFESVELAAREWGCERNDVTVLSQVTEHDWLLLKLPRELRSCVGYMAYEQGHSAGESEVLGILQGLVSDLEEPLRSFGQRIAAQKEFTL